MGVFGPVGLCQAPRNDARVSASTEPMASIALSAMHGGRANRPEPGAHSIPRMGNTPCCPQCETIADAKSTVLSVVGSYRYRTNEGPPGATPFNQYRLMYLLGATARPCETGSGATFSTCTMTEVLQLKLQLGAGASLRRS